MRRFFAATRRDEATRFSILGPDFFVARRSKTLGIRHSSLLELEKIVATISKVHNRL
jgi:hypothetical protein